MNNLIKNVGIDQTYPMYIDNNLLEKSHCILGISPFNSFFSEENITTLINWANTQFRSFQIFIPDKISYYNFVQLGYSEGKAKQKVRKQDNYLYNKIIKSLEMLGIKDEEKQRNAIIKLSDIKSNTIYKNVLSHYKNLLQENEEFRRLYQATTKAIIESYATDFDGLNIMDNNYLIEELPILTHIGKILNIENTVFVYKSIIEILISLYQEPQLYSIDLKGQLFCTLNFLIKN
jgi:cyclo(L-tyrosyl-L-tyrosyl) synthase